MIDNIEDLKNTNLYKKMLSERNIFNAIYCLESYIFEKGLLDTTIPVTTNSGETIAKNDLELYSALADKYNMTLIESVIGICKGKMESIFSSVDALFEVSVYFKVKGEDEKNAKFRPLHTARLTDLICMVSILNCLMFEDSEEGGRRLSDLSKLIPHNFYGNIPSTDLQYLFCKWQDKYKEYTQSVIKQCRAYQNSHQYLTEVCLDIKNFFPSICPKILFNYITEKLAATYDGEDDSMLKLAVSKLLYFRVAKENIESWYAIYYDKEKDENRDDFYMNCGIAQGLPQSYFFGNLCMIEIKKMLMDEECFRGDAYFYVDDSVIYIQSELEENEFNKRISRLNEKLKDYCKQGKEQKSDISEYTSMQCQAFHEKLPYIIEFHKNGKSVFCKIDEADNSLNGYEYLSRETSISSKLSLNLDDVDDYVSLRKLEALDKVIETEIQRLEKDTNNTANDDDRLTSRESSQLKMLRRFKKFFLYRNRLLKIKEAGGITPNILKEYKERFLKEKSRTVWLEQNDQDIFQAEYRLYIRMEGKEKAKELSKSIKEFEKEVLDGRKDNEGCEYLYYAKDTSCSLVLKDMQIDSYKSIIRWTHSNFYSLKELHQDKQFEKFQAFLNERDHIKDGSICMHTMFQKGFEDKEYTTFVLKYSSEFQRKILNVYFSEMIGVQPSDVLSFAKSNSRKMHYTEFRILAFLRNQRFEMNAFKDFIRSLNEKDISNMMGIDMGLLEVLGSFVNYVKRPEWVDSLIQTHRVTKGLWYNGSKFLNSYTLHNEEHAVTLINQSLHIVKTIDYFTLKDVDYYILFLSCYLHDVSMVIHPDIYSMIADNDNIRVLISKEMKRMREVIDKFFLVDEKNRFKESGKLLLDIFNDVYSYFENQIRSQHAVDSAKFIRDRANTLLSHLTPTLISFVAKVSESHGYDVLDVYGLKSRAKDENVSIKYLMILIRLADLMDVANDRVNYHLLRQNIKQMSPTSRFHWISHLVTDKIELSAEYDTDDNKKLIEKPITEKLNFNLNLSVKYLTAEKNELNCKYRQYSVDDGIIKIKIRPSAYNECCDQERCTFLCRWMNKKHEWFLPELVALCDYLYSVNYSLINTEIYFNIKFKNDISLEADMFDDVQEFLQGKI